VVVVVVMMVVILLTEVVAEVKDVVVEDAVVVGLHAPSLLRVSFYRRPFCQPRHATGMY
jgi:hypothetical protein